MKFRSIIYILVAPMACVTSHALAAELKITSNVESANIYQVKSDASPESDETKTLSGKTPFTFDDTALNHTRLIKVEKQGYVPVYIPLFGQFHGTSTIHVSMKKLEEWLPEDSTKRSINDAEKIVDDLYSVQALLDSNKGKQAMGLAEGLHSTYPESVAVSIVYANALLMNGESTRARNIYTAALEQIPDSRKQLKETLTEALNKLSGRMPASNESKKKANP